MAKAPPGENHVQVHFPPRYSFRRRSQYLLGNSVGRFLWSGVHFSTTSPLKQQGRKKFNFLYQESGKADIWTRVFSDFSTFLCFDMELLRSQLTGDTGVGRLRHVREEKSTLISSSWFPSPPPHQPKEFQMTDLLAKLHALDYFLING